MNVPLTIRNDTWYYAVANGRDIPAWERIIGIAAIILMSLLPWYYLRCLVFSSGFYAMSKTKRKKLLSQKNMWQRFNLFFAWNLNNRLETRIRLAAYYLYMLLTVGLVVITVLRDTINIRLQTTVDIMADVWYLYMLAAVLVYLWEEKLGSK